MIDTEQIFEGLDVNYVRPAWFPELIWITGVFLFSFSYGNPDMTFAHAARVYDLISRN